jgi:hypothetical protein
MSDTTPPAASPGADAWQRALRRLRQPATIHQRCTAIAAHVSAGHSPHFTLEPGRLPAVAQRIGRLTQARFPDLVIPYHSRWRHFEAGGVDRKGLLDDALRTQALTGLRIATARARIDLTLISVLLDAGAGPQWRYSEARSGQQFARSEGLAVASFDAFMAGRFSSSTELPLQVDATGLLGLRAHDLAEIFQVSRSNPLVGLEGRVELLHRLGEALLARPDLFTPIGRPGQLLHAFVGSDEADFVHPPAVRAAQILGLLLESFSAIWPSGQRFGPPDEHGHPALPLGDAWRHPAAVSADDDVDTPDAGWVPFHKLSQWLSYSLLEPFEWAGLPVTGLDELTGLPEYRNGGLLLDAGVIVPRDPAWAATPRTPADAWVIEWRALTVALLDELAPLVRAELGVTAAQLPLACMLEGGSWAAGRQIAAERRLGGPPPVEILSDGTVF